MKRPGRGSDRERPSTSVRMNASCRLTPKPTNGIARASVIWKWPPTRLMGWYSQICDALPTAGRNKRLHQRILARPVSLSDKTLLSLLAYVTSPPRNVSQPPRPREASIERSLTHELSPPEHERGPPRGTLSTIKLSALTPSQCTRSITFNSPELTYLASGSSRRLNTGAS